MLIDSRKGQYIVESNYRDAFRLEAFEEKYIEECFDKYLYIVGDISSGILRLKGFDNNPKSKNYYGFIEDYLELSCAMGCPYYVLKRIQSDKEYQQELSNPKEPNTDGFVIHSLTKENFDKENIVLEPTPKGRPNIIISAEKLNKIPKGELTGDLKELTNQEPQNNTFNRVAEKPEVTQSYVSSSPGFVPNQNPRNNNFNNKNRNKNRKRNKK
ncbi:MAG: YutD family protein [Roseburia sp.]|nr:YutD family protein [Anaeroplasma bactoclasticum]MCM1196555.1 YutD family protein [Roseburia sp.]MCM1557622.1 YutD family protein [Anaeroplasma bactoclasticum]